MGNKTSCNKTIKTSPSIIDLIYKYLEDNDDDKERLQLNIIGLKSNKKDKFEKIYTNLTLESRVYELKQFLKNRYDINKNAEILIIYSHSILCDDNNRLSCYGICNNSCLFVSILDNDNDNNNKINNQYIPFQEKSNILNGFKCIKMTDLDILTYELNTNCIKMPCGHGITVETLYFYAESQWKSGEIFIKCPHLISHNNSKCDQIWYYPFIRYILLNSNQFKLDQLIKFELLSSLNIYKKYFNISKCPNCSYNIHRHCNDNKNNDTKRKKTQCPKCKTIFCWKCKGIWLNKSLSDKYYCHNNDCFNFENEINEILLNCSTKTIGSVCNVPEIRSCPKCFQLIYHNEACKHIKCLQCKTDFCFICLKRKLNQKWQCGRYDDQCSIAKRQKYQR